MLKRVDKIIALLVAIATVSTTIPAFATTRLGTQEGEFSQAFSYAEGKFVYNGYRTDDETAIYFNDGDKDEEVEDYDDYDFDEAERYGKKYITIKDGDDTYLLDLSSGKIGDESLEDKEDNVKSQLKTNLKKANRYENFKDSKADVDSDNNKFERILKNKYGEVWYKYLVTGNDDVKDAMDNGEKYIGVVNEDNKYLDLSYLANISIYSASKGKTVKFDKFGDSEDFTKDGKEATLKLVDVNIIDQDDDYLYAVTTVKVEGNTTNKPEDKPADKEEDKLADKEEDKPADKEEDKPTDKEEDKPADKPEDELPVFTKTPAEAKKAKEEAYAEAQRVERIYEKLLNERLELKQNNASKEEIEAVEKKIEISDLETDIAICKYLMARAEETLVNENPEEKKAEAKAEYLDSVKRIKNAEEKLKEINEREQIVTIEEKLAGKSDEVRIEENVAGYQYFFQKISKAQGEKKDGAYMPKSVSSYQIDDGDVFKEDGDRTDAYDLLIQAAGIEKGDKQIVNVEVDESKSMIHVAQLDESDKMKVYKLKYKKDKVDAPEKDKVDAYIVLKDGDTDEDIVDTSDDDAKPYSVDVDGNLWILAKGKIYKYDGDEFKELYTCDRSINNLDVYDKDNLIAWEKDEESFVVLQNGKGGKEGGETEDPNKPIKTDKVGWNKNEDGTWSFYDATGVQVKASWVNVQGTWYYLKEDGIMATGWLQEGGNWYYLNASGAMQTGWLNDNGTWYYLQASGAMAYGWLQDTDGRWYYLSTTSGAMLTNTTIDGYVLGANGAWIN